ncbi:MAG: histidine--tRNA ligase [Candidatus Magasanikbacteria bacterium RIFOXYD2_FULL_41_14]|uniref:Histidine--tRNA ligase n=1 Tax=Candidatus Magasanikbacteria bacterium RIFOXYD2_FULL_41_14 TaxID=1798709 RepID=A0A1F6PEI9_9BACT|nr:MAG: histidine--tRNA ligase [Candidatus Magasanikbacteria bacterium RIFOXYD2_FULL_41_14]
MKTKKKIIPRILKGTRDFLPAEMTRRNLVQSKIVSIFERFGYDSIDTPAIEYAETLVGKYGDDGSKQLYRFEDNGGRDVALRFDQTVPFARLVSANYSQLPMPFKRYQISKVWRADKPAKGRYREFTQCDIDIIGTKNLLAETEIAKAIYLVFKELGFEKFVIKINSRRLINSILDFLKIEKEKQPAIMRILDKLNKIGRDGVTQEMSQVCDVSVVKNILKTMVLVGTNQEKIENLKKYDIAEVEMFLQLCGDAGVPEEFLEFDPSLARGLDYYTGIIYEVYPQGVDIGAVCAGGRYDDLCGMFTDKEISGVGVAFGFDRIVVAMEDLGLLNDVKFNSDVVVAYFDEITLPKSLEVWSQLQTAGINTEIYFEPAKLPKQFAYADKKKVKFVVICGPDEVADNAVTIKNMETGKQKTIPQAQLDKYFSGYTNL